MPERREAKEEKRGLRFQKLRASDERLSIEARGLVPLSQTGAERLLEIFSLRSERGATRVTRNRPFNAGTEGRGSERLTGARRERRTPQVHLLEMNGESYRLQESTRNRPAKPARGLPIHPEPHPPGRRARQGCFPLRPKRAA